MAKSIWQTLGVVQSKPKKKPPAPAKKPLVTLTKDNSLTTKKVGNRVEVKSTKALSHPDFRKHVKRIAEANGGKIPSDRWAKYVAPYMPKERPSSYWLTDAGKKEAAQRNKTIRLLDSKLTTKDSRTEVREESGLGKAVSKAVSAPAVELARTVKALTPDPKTVARSGSAFAAIDRPTGGDLTKKTANILRAATFEPVRAMFSSNKTRQKSKETLAQLTVGGVVAGVANAAVHPADTVEATKKDWKERYGEAAKDSPDWKKVRKQIEDKGAIPYLADATLLAGPTSKAAGLGLKSPAVGAVPGLRAAHKAVTTPRPTLKHDLGKTAVIRQRDETTKRAPSVIRVGLQRGQDSIRRKADDRRVRKGAPLLRRSEDGTDVVPLLRSTRNRLARKETVARPTAQAFSVMRDTQAKAEKAFSIIEDGRKIGDKDVGKLTSAERRGFVAAYALGVPVDSPVPGLIEIRAKLDTESAGRSPKHKFILNVNEIDWLIKNERAAFTPRLGATVAHIQDQMPPLEALDPGLPGNRAALRSPAMRETILGQRDAKLDMGRTMRKDAPEMREAADDALALASDDLARAKHKAEEEPSPSSKVGLLKAQAAHKSAKAQVAAWKEPAPGDFKTWLEDAQQEATARGLGAKAAYFPAIKHPKADLAARTPGGSRMSNIPKPYTGSAVLSGKMSTNPSLLIDAVNRGIKRSVMWPAVNEIRIKAALPFGGEKGASISKLDEHVADKGYRANEVAYFFPNLIEANLAKIETAGDILKKEDPDKFAEDVMSPDLDADVRSAIQSGVVVPGSAEYNAIVKADHLSAQADPNYQPAKGFIIQRPTYDELDPTSASAAQLRKKWMRGLNIGKSTASRNIFFLSVPWARDNALTSAALTALNGGTPAGYRRMTAIRNKLAPDAQRQFDAIADIDGRWVDRHRPRLGEAAGPIAEKYIAFRKTPFGSVRPLRATSDFWHHVENRTSNKPFRMALFYKEIEKSSKLHGLTVKMGAFNRGSNILARIADLPPEQQLAALKKHDVAIQEAAANVATAAGDFLTFTKAERVASTFIMFYPWIRFSTRLMFKTLPLEHPAMLALMAQLNTANMEQLKALYNPPDDPATPEDESDAPLPPWFASKVRVGEDTVWDVKRINPIGSVVSESMASGGTVKPLSLGKALNPALAIPAGWSGKNPGKGLENFILNGKIDRFGDSPNVITDPKTFGKLTVAQLMNLNKINREYVKATDPSPMSEESSIFSRVPMQSPTWRSDPITRYSWFADKKLREKNKGWEHALKSQFSPLTGTEKDRVDRIKWRVKTIKAAREKMIEDAKAGRR